ncbi:hypothetical protein L1887_58616 [Cichorium endivia]|nr:hypothetical protein L1887_58616 [Cichorium endivia]
MKQNEEEGVVVVVVVVERERGPVGSRPTRDRAPPALGCCAVLRCGARLLHCGSPSRPGHTRQSKSNTPNAKPALRFAPPSSSLIPAISPSCLNLNPCSNIASIQLLLSDRARARPLHVRSQRSIVATVSPRRAPVPRLCALASKPHSIPT